MSQPEVTVADSEHLLVNWEKSFEDCNSSEVVSAQVHIGSDRVDVAFAEKEAKIRANPCLVHRRILVRVHSTESPFLLQRLQCPAQH